MNRKFCTVLLTAVLTLSACTDISERTLVSDPFDDDESTAATLPQTEAMSPTENLPNEISVYGLPASRAAETIFVGDSYAAGVIDVRGVDRTSVVPPEHIISNIALTPRNIANEYVHYGDSDITVVAAVKLAAAAIREKDETKKITIALMFYPPDSSSNDYIYGYAEFIQVIKAAVSDAEVVVIAPGDAATEYIVQLREAVSGIAEFIKFEE